MQRHAFLIAFTAMMAALGCAHCPPATPVATYDSDAHIAAFAAMQTYRYGDNREVLSAVEDIVRAEANGPDAGKALAADLAALLHARGTTHDAKQFICRQLWIIGTEDEVAVLAPLLTDPKTSGMARYALEGIPSAQADEALLDALPRTAGATKAGIIGSLGQRRAGTAREALHPLTADADPVVAAAAVSALERLGS